MDGYHDAAPVKDLPCEFTSLAYNVLHAKSGLAWSRSGEPWLSDHGRYLAYPCSDLDYELFLC